MKRTLVIKKNRDFTRLYRRGKTAVAGVLVTYAGRNRTGETRIGITATKKVGGAVERNRAKRLIRAAYSSLEDSVPSGWDFIFVARTRTTAAKMQEVRDAMCRQIRSLTEPKPKAPADGAKKPK